MKKFILFLIVLLIIVISSVLFANFSVKKVNTPKAHSIPLKPSVKIINVPTICQYPSLPTGCETVAATMVLQYYGADITPEHFAERWLKKSENFYYSNNELYGPDPNEVFAGNPFKKQSYGCFSLPIIEAINGNCSDIFAQRINLTLAEICEEYIERDKPILIWATMGMKQSEKGRQWYLQNGALFTWTAGEHCLVLVGYDKDCYYLNDPQTGTTVSYKKALTEQRFKELGSQAVYIDKR